MSGLLRRGSIHGTIRILCTIVLFGLLGVRVLDPPIVKEIRNAAFDRFQILKPREYTPQPVRIIDIDEKSLRTVGQWPWPRTKIAELIDNLAKYGVATTGFDVIFSEADRLSPSTIAADNSTLPDDVKAKLSELPDNEVIMRDAMKRHRVVLGETSVRNISDKDKKERKISDAPHAAIGENPRQFMTSFPDIVQNLEILNETASGRGVFSVDQEADGVIRRIPLVMLIREKVRLALAAETLRVATGTESFAIKANEAGIESVVVAGQQISTDANGNIWPYYTEYRQDRYVSAADVLDTTADPKKLTGHLVLVGTSAVGLEDYRSIPLGTRVPGVEIHAQLIENMLSGQRLIRPFFALLYELGAILAVSLLIIVFVPRLGATGGASFAILTFIGFGAASWYAFAQHRILLDPTWPILTALALFILTATANYIREERRRQQIRTAFGQYLSPALVNQLSDDPDKLVLGGETRELTVLFTDIRGFTTIAESYKEYPEGLTRLMNRFLNVLSEPILNRNGTIDKYMGDAIMAFWNAPFDYEHHVMQACVASLEMIENIDRLNKERFKELEGNTEETYHEINVGIGVNTGLAVVGNMGSEIRFDYTALGDTVNIASRLEGQSKPYGIPIVIGPETADRIDGQLASFEVDMIRVKGKNEPIRIYALVGREELAQNDEFKEFRAINSAMLASYRARDWEAAFDTLEMMEELSIKLKLPTEEYLLIYESRITEFEANPPGANWDGVYTATSK